ncbi:hypothetical protein VN97_g8517 [Penicillium thymicola]|uniref:Uncharacterized protein n=1 Tax=Penicillium thymicola TaxID=293382 RepID=A0AAI9TDL3_PENTH|nr:hypothetical protein VN97_g8517 [Penicillium thymicola]
MEDQGEEEEVVGCVYWEKKAIIQTMKTDLLDILFYTYIPDYSSGHLIFSPKHLHPHTSTHQHLNTYTTHTPLIP